MRYIRTQKIVKKVFDNDIDSVEVIKEIMSSIMSRELFCSLIIDKNYRIENLVKCRILMIDEDCFSYRCFKDRVSVVDKAKYSEIRELKLETEIEKAMKIEDSEKRWNVLDFEEMENEKN